MVTTYSSYVPTGTIGTVNDMLNDDKYFICMFFSGPNETVVLGKKLSPVIKMVVKVLTAEEVLDNEYIIGLVDG